MHDSNLSCVFAIFHPALICFVIPACFVIRACFVIPALSFCHPGLEPGSIAHSRSLQRAVVHTGSRVCARDDKDGSRVCARDDKDGSRVCARDDKNGSRVCARDDKDGSRVCARDDKTEADTFMSTHCFVCPTSLGRIYRLQMGHQQAFVNEQGRAAIGVFGIGFT